MNLSIDSGGTFTDIVVEQNGFFTTYKIPSDNLNPYRPVVEFLEKSKYKDIRSMLWMWKFPNSNIF